VAARSPRTAALLIAALRKAYNRAIDEEAVETNPFARLKTAKSASRDRYLSESEIRGVLANLSDLGGLYSHVVLMLLWTAARRGEVLGMKWREIHLEDGLWRIPAERTKNGQPHDVMLPKQATELLQQRSSTVDSEWVFPSPRWADRPIRKDTLNHALRKAIPAWGIEHFGPHDLRRTVATHLTGKFACPRTVLTAILNHTDSSVTARYDRHRYQSEARRYLQVWANWLDDQGG
jgi:integrase